MDDIGYSEVIIVGRRALKYLQDARASLDSAWGWGVADTLGGGLFPGHFKHSDIRKSKKQIEKAKRELETFSNMLGSINIFDEPSLEIDSFIELVDLWWDNILIDFIMQNRIKEAQKQIDETIAALEHILSELLRENVRNYFSK